MSDKNYPPFDLAKALAGAPCVLRDGRRYYVKHDTSEWSSSHYPLIGHAEGSTYMIRHRKEGKRFEFEFGGRGEIVGMWVEPHELEGMPKDHPIWE